MSERRKREYRASLKKDNIISRKTSEIGVERKKKKNVFREETTMVLRRSSGQPTWRLIIDFVARSVYNEN